MKKSVLILVVFVVLGFPVVSYCEEKQGYSCYRLAEEPVLDGNLRNDSGWDNIPEMRGFFVLAPDFILAVKQTRFKIGYSSESLYIGVECEEPEIGEIKAKLKDMQNLWEEDSVEIFIFPKEMSEYYQFIVTPLGSRWNGIIGQGGHSLSLDKWQVKTYKGEDYWSVEVKLPFELFGKTPQNNEEWKGNICRNILTSGGDRFSCWAHLTAGFHEPSGFGRIIFKDKSLSREGAKKAEKEFRQSITLKREIGKRLELFSSWRESLLENSKDPLKQKEVASLLKSYEEIEKQASSLDTLSLKEMRFLLKESIDFFEMADALRGEMLRESFFEER